MNKCYLRTISINSIGLGFFYTINLYPENEPCITFDYINIESYNVITNLTDSTIQTSKSIQFSNDLSKYLSFKEILQ